MNKQLVNILANIFYEMCLGKTDGHMSAIPNNRIIYAVLMANCDSQYTMDKLEFAKTLRAFANAFEEEI